MNDAKFASITSALLVRKGEAAPSVIDSAPIPALEIHRTPRSVAKRHDAGADGDRRRRVVITLNGDEFIRLGIVAAKKNSTRHDLVRDALFEQLNAFARDEAADCRCVRPGEDCACQPATDAGDMDSGVAAADAEFAAMEGA